MTRENQGLQIALIVSVMLTVIFGGMTYYWYRQYDDANTRSSGYSADLRTKKDEADAMKADVATLKKMIGVPDTEKPDINGGTFKDDMAKYGGALPETEHDYRRVMDKMQKTIEEKNAALSDAKTEVAKLQQQITAFEASKQPQIDDFKKSRDDANQDLAGERAKFDAERKRINDDREGLAKERDTARKEKDAEKAEAEKTQNKMGADIKTLQGVIVNQANEIAKVTATKVDSFDGEVRFVDQRNGTIWIDRGRADALRPLITFSIYPADTTDLTATGAKKASIEVTHILDDHLSQARIIDDKITDPIIPGDKIHTPLWAPGGKKHFALAGFMDVFGDNKNHVRTVMDLIEMNDGVVDAWVDDKGNLQGAITVNTRFLILGDPPDEKNAPALLDSYSKLIGTSQRLGIQRLPLADMLQRAGWKNPTPVVHYGIDANAKDFAPKPPEGAPRTSPGDVFKPRQPPAGNGSAAPSAAPSTAPSKGPPSAYYRFSR